MSGSRLGGANSRFQIGLNDETLALLGCAVVLFGAVLWTANAPNAEKTDFSLTYVGAKIVHDGLGRKLYDMSLQKQLRDSIYQHPVPLFFEHPPFEALLLSPLAAVPFRTAYLIWGLVNATVLLALILLLRSYLSWPTEGIAYVFMWLLFAPLWVTLYQGQTSLLLLTAYFLSFAMLKRDKNFHGGLALGLGLFKFQFVVPFVFIFLLRRKWRFVGGFMVAATAAAILSLAAVGRKGIIQYAQFLLAISKNPQNVHLGSGVDMPTIHGFTFAILGQTFSGRALSLIVALLSLGLVIWMAWRWDQLNGQGFDLMFSAAIASALLCGSHMFAHDFSPLILAMLLAASHVRALAVPGRVLWPSVATKVALALFWAVPIYFLFVKWHCLFLLAPVLFLFVWGATNCATLPVRAVRTLTVTG